MQKYSETFSATINGAFHHLQTVKFKRRVGMSGAYVRHIVHGTVTVTQRDTGWIYVKGYFKGIPKRNTIIQLTLDV